jgi:hypothetical protein
MALVVAVCLEQDMLLTMEILLQQILVWAVQVVAMMLAQHQQVATVVQVTA